MRGQTGPAKEDPRALKIDLGSVLGSPGRFLIRQTEISTSYVESIQDGTR